MYVLCVYMFIYAKVRFLEKFYLYMFSDLVHFRLVSFLEKKEEEEKVLYMQKYVVVDIPPPDNFNMRGGGRYTHSPITLFSHVCMSSLSI
jgi:hypothetical protein